jgi:hypothetical protein
MDATENGTTSQEGLAKRLEALERENADSRGKVAALEGSRGRRDEGRISRRRLLGKAGTAAAGLVVAGALTQRDIRQAKAVTVETSGIPETPAVKATNTVGGTGVYAEGLNGGRGVNGEGLYGVQGLSKGALAKAYTGITRPQVTGFSVCPDPYRRPP